MNDRSDLWSAADIKQVLIGGLLATRRQWALADDPGSPGVLSTAESLQLIEGGIRALRRVPDSDNRFAQLAELAPSLQHFLDMIPDDDLMPFGGPDGSLDINYLLDYLVQRARIAMAERSEMTTTPPMIAALRAVRAMWLATAAGTPDPEMVAASMLGGWLHEHGSAGEIALVTALVSVAVGLADVIEHYEPGGAIDVLDKSMTLNLLDAETDPADDREH